jgi:hypothetical protein
MRRTVPLYLYRCVHVQQHEVPNPDRVSTLLLRKLARCHLRHWQRRARTSVNSVWLFLLVRSSMTPPGYDGFESPINTHDWFKQEAKHCPLDDECQMTGTGKEVKIVLDI